ncbi:MAG TPA: transcription antitermination factor NusB [Vicinamibacterales bacterium]|nr:transcription antitermination factor NusB [Vicinamibacterales bacterium]
MSDLRSQGREAALQILYFAEVGKTAPEEAVEAFFAGHGADASADLRAFAREIVLGVTTHLLDLDMLIQRHSEHWRLERLAVIDRLILRIGAWEFQHSEAPPAVVIDEAIELARRFSGDQAVGFVNGVLDGIRKTLDVQRS